MIREVNFSGSFPTYKLCPADGLPQYAFIGRSNVGKSSLINYLTNRKGLAKVSNKPGKTQLLNFFQVDEAWYLVDLPGYGYAKESKKKRKQWEMMIRNYLKFVKDLQCTFVLIDGSIPPQKLDMDFINWLGENRLPFAIIFTKIDKVKKQNLDKNLDSIRQVLYQSWESLPAQFLISSVKKRGQAELIGYIEELNKVVKTYPEN
jgi:GTP-binding protein